VAEGLTQRVQTAVLFGIPVLGLVFYSNLTRTIFIALLIGLTAMEYLQLHYQPLSAHISSVIFASLGTFVIAMGSYTGYIPEYVLLIIGLISSIIYLVDLLLKEQAWLRQAPGLTTLLYTTIPFSILLAQHSKPYFHAVLIGALVLIWISDSGAYFVGKSLGKRKLMPSVSPGKSWEGFWGAGMCTMLASYIFASLLGVFSFKTWALIALCVWVFGSLGDLVESKLKRKLRIKDSGTILPGHGGFLDRFDGFYFCLPFVILVINLTHNI